MKDDDDLPKIVCFHNLKDDDEMSAGVGWAWVSYYMLIISLLLWFFV